jgi:hypothetical protein
MAYDPTAGPKRAPDLERLAAGTGWRLVWTGCAALLGGVFFTILAFIGPFFFCITPLLFLAGFLGIPAGLLRVASPLSHASIGPLGRTTAARRAALKAIEAEIMLPETRHRWLADGGWLSATPGWIAYYGGAELLLARRDDVLWVYEKRKRSRSAIIVKTLGAGNGDWSVADREVAPVLELLADSCPRAVHGFDEALHRLSGRQLAAAVDRRGGQ